MLTQLTATVPVETARVLPASPGEISPEASLEELNAIKSAWTQEARDMNYPAKACHVAFWLGREVITHPREHIYKIWSSESVHLLVREYEERYQAADGTRMKVCILLGFIGEPDLTHKNPVDQILLSTRMFKVVNWRWSIFAGEVKDWQENYFIPGNWIDVFLAVEAEANEISARAEVDQQESERQQLLAELLAGHNL
jgi:hypothetical protein